MEPPVSFVSGSSQNGAKYGSIIDSSLYIAEVKELNGDSKIPKQPISDNILEDDSSLVEQVALTVLTTDDPTLPVWTFRMWLIGLASCMFLSFLNQFFYYRTEPLVISSIAAQVVALPIGRFLAAVLPTRSMQFPFTTWSFTLNPGPFNKKEHVLIAIFANAGTAFGHGGAVAVSIINITKVFYKRNIGFLTGLLVVITTQIFGYGWAGLVRKYLVEPSHMWWPRNMVQVSLFRTLHENDNSRGLSRMKFFIMVMLLSCAYYALPGYLFMTLSSLSWVCWAWPHSVTAQQLGSGLKGLSLGTISLDWATISAYLSSPLVSPWFVTVNVMVGSLLFIYVILPAAYWSNLYNAKNFPIFSSHLFTSSGQRYDISSIVNDKFELDIKAYNAKGPIHLSTFFALTYGFGFATLTATITHVLCFHGREVWQRSRAAFRDVPDIHTRLMRKYPDIPHSWFAALLFVSVAVSIATCERFKQQLQLPWWGILLACFLSLVFVFPIGVITATTNQTPGLNILTEYIMGYIMPGRPIANVVFKAYGYLSIGQAIAFLQDFKLGHYMKIPPRSMFIVQVVGTIVSGTINMGTAWWLLHSIENICDTTHLPANSPWTCPSDRVIFDASVIWGLVGPKRIFGSLGEYKHISWFFLVGAIAPIVVWIFSKAFPKALWIPLINMPVIFGATALMPPATPVNYVSWSIVGVTFNFFIFRYQKQWWKRYNYILSAALDAGLAFMGVLIYISLGLVGRDLTWWGNKIDNCPLATCPTSTNVIVSGCPLH